VIGIPSAVTMCRGVVATKPVAVIFSAIFYFLVVSSRSLLLLRKVSSIEIASA
jgi:hypothetical protein